MNEFARLLDRLALEPGRNDKVRLLTAYFASTTDPDRGLALAAMAGDLPVPGIRPAMARALVASRVDPDLFAMSYDFVGDLAETIALIWPRDGERGHNNPPAPTLSVVIEALRATGKTALPARLAALLDDLDEIGRWALLKLLMGGLRIGVSARLAKTAVAALGAVSADDIEEVWHGLAPPYEDLFAWAEGKGPRPQSSDAAPFRPPMLAHALDDAALAALVPGDFIAEWKWDGVRAQAAVFTLADGERGARLYSRAGEDLGGAFPDMLDALRGAGFPDAVFDGELLVRDEKGAARPFSDLQARLNRKNPTPKMLRDTPPLLRLYDLLTLEGEDLRPLPFMERRARLEAVARGVQHPAFDLSPTRTFDSIAELVEVRKNAPLESEGLMLKRRDAPYVSGRPTGQWWKWKRDPMEVDAVLMFAQRGHGKRASLYSDYTFGVWRGSELVPVGKAYFGFTDAELKQLDKWVREHSVSRFGPVREVAHEPANGLVLQIAFEGLNRSPRHKSGLAMRFPRVARIRWDKPPAEADRIEALEALLPAGPAKVANGAESGFSAESA